MAEAKGRWDSRRPSSQHTHATHATQDDDTHHSHHTPDTAQTTSTAHTHHARRHACHARRLDHYTSCGMTTLTARRMTQPFTTPAILNNNQDDPAIVHRFAGRTVQIVQARSDAWGLTGRHDGQVPILWQQHSRRHHLYLSSQPCT